MPKRESLVGRGPTIGQIAKAADVLGLKVDVRLVPRPKVHLDSSGVDPACQFCGKVERSACGLEVPQHHTNVLAKVTCRRCRAIGKRKHG